MAQQPRYLDNKYEMELSSRLNERRRRLLHETGEHRYTGVEIAKRCGITGGALCRWEYGEAIPQSFAAWKRWAGALGTRLEIRLAT